MDSLYPVPRWPCSRCSQKVTQPTPLLLGIYAPRARGPMPPNRPTKTRTGAKSSPRAPKQVGAVLGHRSEDSHQREMIGLLGSLGWRVYSLSQGYRKEKGGTRMTPGIPDLYALHPSKGLTLWIEVKPPKEAARLAKLLTRTGPIPKSYMNDLKRARAQATFKHLCEATGQPYCYGTLPELLACLRSLGFGL